MIGYAKLSARVAAVVLTYEKVPGHGAEPGQVVHLVDRVANVDDLSKALHKKRARGVTHNGRQTLVNLWGFTRNF